MLISTITSAMPVELSYFSVSVANNNVTLLWGTVSEVNNDSFLIERKNVDSINWIVRGSVQGSGTSNIPHDYLFNDTCLSNGSYYYRLKQVDFGGSYNYHDLNSIIVVNTVSISNQSALSAEGFNLHQNYPNPFNPSTEIRFSVAENVNVTLKVYDMSGKEVAVLVNEMKSKGEHSVAFNASGLSSGTYFYKFKAGSVEQVKKMTLVK
jgi:hypothetical protein